MVDVVHRANVVTITRRPEVARETTHAQPAVEVGLPGLRGPPGTSVYEVITASRVITSADMPRTFVLDNAAGLLLSLPAPALSLRFDFLVRTAPIGGTYTVVANTNVLTGFAVNAEGAAGDSRTNADLVYFEDGQALPGDRMTIDSDGVSWFVHGACRQALGILFGQRIFLDDGTTPVTLDDGTTLVIRG